MRFVDRLSLSSFAIASGIIANIGGATAFFLSGPTGDWVKSHPVAVFWIAISINLALLSVSGTYQSKLHDKDESIESLKGLLESRERESRATITEKDERIETFKHQNRTLELQFQERSETQREQIDILERENRKLKELLNPSEHDKNLFREVLNELPWQGGVLSYFHNGFDGKKWFGDRVDPLYDFSLKHRESFFDDIEMQTVFQDLKDACAAMVDWLSFEGAPSAEGASFGAVMYKIAPAENRVGGHEAFAAARREAFSLADALRVARRAFEQLGRKLRL